MKASNEGKPNRTKSLKFPGFTFRNEMNEMKMKQEKCNDLKCVQKPT